MQCQNNLVWYRAVGLSWSKSLRILNSFEAYVSSDHAQILFIMYVDKFSANFEGNFFQISFCICVITTF